MQLALLLVAVLVAWVVWRSGLPGSAQLVAFAVLAATLAAHAWGRAQYRHEFLISERGIDERRRRIDWLPRRVEEEVHLPGEAIARLYARHPRSGVRWYIGQVEPPEISAWHLRRSWCVEVEARGQCIEITGRLDFSSARNLLLDISRSLAGTNRDIALPRASTARSTSKSNDAPTTGDLR